MGKDRSHEPSGEQGLDEALRAAFESQSPDSVLKKIEKLTGVKSRVLIHDDVEDPSPMIRVQGLESESAEDDSRYQVVGEIARGGVGVVHKARDRDLGRDVALKVLRKDFADNSGVFARFIEEAQIGGQLQHPGIVPVYGMALQPDGRPSFAMKLIKGRTLAAALKKRKSPTEDRRRFLAIFEQIALTMGYAHTRGVIHRDLKPSNILVGNFGEVLVVDWGFGKVLGRPEPEKPETTIVATVRSTGEGSESLAGSVMGTPAYMPPEQALGQVEEMDEQSDVFALGSILTEILTGKPAYSGASKELLVMAAQAKLVDAFDRLAACQADAQMVDLARRCLASLGSERPENAMAVAKEVGEHLTTVEERARQAELSAVEERARLERETKQAAWERKARRKVMALAACVLVAVLLGCGAWLKLDSDRRSRAEAARPAVEQAMEEATRLGGQGQWDEAIAVAKKAVALAEEADEETRDRAKVLFQATTDEKAAAAAEAAQAAKDRAFVDGLEEVRAIRGENPDLARNDDQFESLFREYGFDLAGTTAEAVSAHLLERGIAVRVAAILDEQSMTRKHLPQLKGRDWELLLRIASLSDPDPLRSRLRIALRYEDTEAVIGIAAEALSEDLPAVTLTVIGLALQRPGRFLEAAEFLRRAYPKHPEDFWLTYALARTLAFTGEWESAVRYRSAALALRPDSWFIWADLGHAQQMSGEFERAEKSFRRSLELNPDNSTVYANLSSLLSATNRPDEAMAASLKALELNPRESCAYNNLGTDFYRRRQLDEAGRAFETAIQLHPNVHLYHRNLGNVFTMIGKYRPDTTKAMYAAAIEAYREALRLAPGEAKTHWALAEVYSRLFVASRAFSPFGATKRSVGESYRNEAIALLSEAARLQPARAYTHLQLGFMLATAGRIKEAIDSYRASLRLQHSGMAALNLGNALVLEGRLAEAAELYRSELERTPQAAELICNLGQILLRQGRFKEGLAALQRGHKAGTGRGFWLYPSEAWIHAARTLLAGGRVPDDAKVFEVAKYIHGWCLHAHAARIYRDASTDALDATPDARSIAAVAAARAGCGLGFLSPEAQAERAGCRKQALAWLNAEQARLRDGDPLLFRWNLWKWEQDPDLACVRNETQLAKLPEAERREWATFWKGVRDVISAAGEGD